MTASTDRPAMSSPVEGRPAQVPYALLADRRVTVQAFRLWVWLAQLDQGTHPSAADVGKVLGGHSRSIGFWFKCLHDAGWITRTQRFGDSWKTEVHRIPVDR